MKKPGLYFRYPGGLGRFEFCTHKCQNKTVCMCHVLFTRLSLENTQSTKIQKAVPKQKLPALCSKGFKILKQRLHSKSKLTFEIFDILISFMISVETQKFKYFQSRGRPRLMSLESLIF